MIFFGLLILFTFTLLAAVSGSIWFLAVSLCQSLAPSDRLPLILMNIDCRTMHSYHACAPEPSTVQPSAFIFRQVLLDKFKHMTMLFLLILTMYV
jgi:hypothetical protein